MKVGYFVKSLGQTIEDTTYLDETEFQLYRPLVYEKLDLGYYKRDIVKEVCEWAWINDSGPEWLNSGKIITLVVDGVEKGDFTVEVELEPYFYVKDQVKKPEVAI